MLQILLSLKNFALRGTHEIHRQFHQVSLHSRSIDSILWMTIINSTHNITIITILIWTNNALRCSAAPMPADGSNQARLDIPAC